MSEWHMQNTQESIRAKLSLLITSGQQRRKMRGTFHLLAWVVFQVDTFCLLECQPTFYICISWFSDINFFAIFKNISYLCPSFFALITSIQNQKWVAVKQESADKPSVLSHPNATIGKNTYMLRCKLGCSSQFSILTSFGMNVEHLNQVQLGCFAFYYCKLAKNIFLANSPTY